MCAYRLFLVLCLLFGIAYFKECTNNFSFTKIMCERSLPHLKAVFSEYEKLSGKPMKDVIKSKCPRNSEDIYISLGKKCTVL